MMLHLEPPEVKGYGSITTTSGFDRTAQVLITIGLPLRTTRTTTDLVTKPSYWFWLQVLSTRPASTSRAMSGASENSTTSAGSPASTARLCSPDEPYDSLNSTFAPASVFWKAGISSA